MSNNLPESTRVRCSSCNGTGLVSRQFQPVVPVPAIVEVGELREAVLKLKRYSIACSGLVVNGVEDMEITEMADGQYLFRPDVLAAVSAKEKS